MASVPNGIETLPKISIAWVGCTNVTDRQTTDGRTNDESTTYSELSLKIGDFVPTRSLWQDLKFQVEGDIPHQSFARIFRQMNALQRCRWQFSHKETLYIYTFFKRDGKRPFRVFEPSSSSLEVTYDDHLRLVGKCVVDFLLVIIELFLLDVTAEALRANIGWKSAILLQRESVDPKFQVEGVAPH